jgi:hypothetical protein
MNLKITRAKPNPSGKDVTKPPTVISQLSSEWVDIQNMGKSPINTNGIELFHLAYLSNGKSKWEVAIKFSEILEAGKVVRVHSGKPIPVAQMNYQDRFGADHHVFTEKNYIWNNDKPDKPSLWHKPKKEWVDQVEYIACPLEGKILKRIGNKLV